MIEKAKQLNVSKEEKEKLKESQTKIYSENSFYEEMINTFTTKERSQLKLYKLDNYCIFIASRYFNDVSDHINLTLVSKRMRGNIEKNHQFKK